MKCRALPPAAAVAAALTLACCGKEQAAAPAPTATKTVHKAEAPQPAQDGGQQFSYSPVGKRDPFYSYIADLESSIEAASQRKHEPTEAFELDQYRLTGLVTGTAQPRAMVEDPEGKGHVIKIGSRLGKHGGVVTRINGDGLVVTEEITAPTGERVRVPMTIKLPQPELELGADK